MATRNSYEPAGGCAPGSSQGRRNRSRARDLHHAWRVGRRPRCCSVTERATCQQWSPHRQRPLSDTRSHVLALVGTTALSWEEVPVFAGCGLARANVEGRLDGVAPGGGNAPFSRSRSAPAGGARDWHPRPRGFLTGSEFEPGAEVHHRRAPGVDRADDLLGVDPLEVTRWSWTDTNGRAGAGLRAGARLRGRARQRGHGGADVAQGGA